MKYIKYFESTSINKESAMVVLKFVGTKKILVLSKKDGWCLPGGKIESGEGIKAGAIRELYEETGIILDEWDRTIMYCGKSFTGKGRTVHVYYVETNDANVELSPEHSDFKWVDINAINKMRLSGNTRLFVELAKLYF